MKQVNERDTKRFLELCNRVMRSPRARGAASVGAVLALAPAGASAAIHNTACTGSCSVSWSPPGASVNIDIDADGTTEFRINNLSAINNFSNMTANARFSGNSGYDPYNRGSGFAVPPAVTYWRSNTSDRTLNSSPGVAGNFNNTSGYIPVKFDCPPDTGPGTCYGWIRYQGTVDGGTVLSWGYNDQPEGSVTTDPPTLVELVSLSASSGTGGIRVEWVTAAELDNAGFNVLRSQARDGEYSRVNSDLIPAEGSAASGGAYAFLDTDPLEIGATYWYKLEDVDMAGGSALHGPVAVEVRPGFCGTMPASPGFNLISLFFPPAATILWWMRRREGKRTGKR